jgi:hypothetical protein
LRLPREPALAVEIHQDRIEAHSYLEHGKCFTNKENNFNKLEVAKSECDGLFTNRLLWLSASAGALPLWGSGCRNLALRAFMNKPYPFLSSYLMSFLLN